ncbi:MAG TPA: hypothetical protein VEA99_13980 [Gemmatimonadaceae bacterium]|nr:hypothetical protein [Gemmatimonadaceae bacterium]
MTTVPPSGRGASPAGRPAVPPGFNCPRVRLVEARGRQVILFDLAGMQSEAEMVALVQGPFRQFMDAQRPGAGLLTMVDTSDTPTSPGAVSALRDFAQRNTPLVAASAVAADRPMHRLSVSTIAMFTKRKIRAFADRAAALEWLSTQ